MPRALPTAIVVVSVLAGGAPAHAAGPPLSAALVSCQTGRDSARRHAVFTASMPSMADTRRMAMRFDLYERATGAASYVRLRVPKWGVWVRSHDGVPGFIFTKRVDRLAPPASYRAVVRFRWYDAQGRVQGQARRETGPCRQPDLRPNLTVASVTTDGRDYLVELRNDGRGDAGPFSLSLRVDDLVVILTIDGLAAGRSRTVAVGQSRCRPADRVFLRLDGDRMVDETDETDNAVSRPCPFADSR